MKRLRNENRELRSIVDVYGGEIQRLTIENSKLTAALAEPSNVRGLRAGASRVTPFS